ncbi:MAG: membrane fusion protein, multidrug efflux system [Verrucomicrobia bacterium]|jgi:membrane fusion protein (multidrug efflux system)|nr:MAG: membrane fusion protein, multidrug efflux system [Verrucomicrobiota bacterium]
MARPDFLFRFLLLVLTVGIAACGSHQTGSPVKTARPPALVKTAAVGKGDFALPLRVIGTVNADESSDISSNVTETVAELFFEDGQRVQKGQLLAQLGNAEEEALLASAKSVLAEEEREIERLRGLVAEGAAAEARLAERRTLAEIARQRIREAEAKLADRRVVAPFDGWLGLRRISAGALVSPGKVITTIDKLDVVKIDFGIPETVLGSIQAGTEIVATTESLQHREFKGRVKHLDTRLDPVTRSVQARAEVANPDLALRPGMLTMVELRLEPRRSLAIPERALVPMGSRQQVFTVGGDSAAPVAKLIEIETGRRVPGSVEVLRGLEEGARVITDGLVGLLDGSAIRLAGEYEGPVAPLNPERTKP